MGYQSSKETYKQENKSEFAKIQGQKIDVKDDPKIFNEQNKIKEENKNQPHERNNPKISQKKQLDKHPILPHELFIETQKSICKIVIGYNGGS